MTSSQLQSILSALPSDIPVYLYVEGREPVRCLCGEVLYAYRDDYYTVNEAHPMRLYGGETADCLVLYADAPL